MATKLATRSACLQAELESDDSSVTSDELSEFANTSPSGSGAPSSCSSVADDEWCRVGDIDSKVKDFYIDGFQY
jgi:hypothetical protein